MSLYHNFVVSEYRHYDYTNTFTRPFTKSQQVIAEDDYPAPPSYSAVLAEKQWDEKLIEMNDLLCAMKRSMKDTQLMLKTYQKCCQRFELKNKTLLLSLEKESKLISDIDTTSFDAASQSEHTYNQDANDSLSRMNHSLQQLIDEAESSLNTRLSLHADPCLLRKSRSCPRFTSSINLASRRRKSSDVSIQQSDYADLKLQQKKRYLHSQWKLAIAMKQFIEAVQQTTITTSTKKTSQRQQQQQQHIIHHHVYHHHHYIHHHYPPDNRTLDSPLPALTASASATTTTTPSLPAAPRKMIRSASSLTSLFKFAIDTVHSLVPKPPSVQPCNLPKPTQYRAMFLSTLLVSGRFTHTSLWMHRSQCILSAFYKFRQLYHLWRCKAHLLFFIIQLFVLKKTTIHKRVKGYTFIL